MADQVLVSGSNRTPVVQIVTWFCLAVSVLAFFSHAGIKIYLVRSITIETGFAFLALIFGTAQSVSVIIQTTNGFGKPSSSLESGQLETVLKCEYAATILFLFCIALSKLAIAAFIHGLSPKKLDHRLNYALGGFSTLWLVVSVFIAAFQCRTPHTWDKTSGNCLNAFQWWEVVSILNIVSEIALVALEISIMIPLHISRSRKVYVVSLFTCRLLVSTAAAIQLYLFQQDSSGPQKDDYTLGYWRSTISNQIVQSLAIVTTSLPYTSIFMQSFESGLIGIEEPGWKTERSTEGNSRVYELLDVSKSSASRPNDGISKTQTYTVESSPKK